MVKTIRIDCTGNDGRGPTGSMTGITVRFDLTETDFHMAKAKALGFIVQELCRYGLHEALNGIGILDEHGKRMKEEAEKWAAGNRPIPSTQRQPQGE